MNKETHAGESGAPKIATLEDFRASHEVKEPVRKVLLPKLGKHVLIRKPSMTWFAVNGFLPLGLSASVSKANGDDVPMKDRINALRENAEWMRKVLEATLVEPKCNDELLAYLDVEDAGYIVQVASGVVVIADEEGNEAKSLETFRPQ